MEKDILAELEKSMKERHLKIPAVAALLGIPKDRMYKWYQEGTKPKTEDAVKIWNWINGGNSNSNSNIVEEPQARYWNLAQCISIIESQQKLLADQHQTLQSQQETIRMLISGNGGSPRIGKKAS